MTVDEAKAYLRIDTGREDALVGRLVDGARALCEAFLGRRLIRRTFAETLGGASGWQRLAETPVAAITAVEANGVAVPSDQYAVDIDPAGDGWVRWSGSGSGSGRVRVTYVAGIADDPAAIPAAIAQGITRLVAHLYAHRDDSVGPPAAVAALWRPYRRIRLGLETRA